jgi:hypothetical protein
LPRPEERCRIWSRSFPSQITFADDVDWRDLAVRFDLTGAGIVNVAHFCVLEAPANATRRVDCTARR